MEETEGAVGPGRGARSLWMPDETSTHCTACRAAFRVFRRKHHCRVCGQIFCSRCSLTRIPGVVLGLTELKCRVCDTCATLVEHEAEPTPRPELVTQAPPQREPLQRRVRPHSTSQGAPGRSQECPG